jgi:hypothetical protein
MKLKLRRIAVVLTAALPLAAATIPTKAEAFGFLLAPALLGSALLGAGAFGGGLRWKRLRWGRLRLRWGRLLPSSSASAAVLLLPQRSRRLGWRRLGWWLVRQLSTKPACARRIAC